MGKAMELLTGLATAPTQTMAAVTALTGNSFTLRDSRRAVRMLAQLDRRQVAGITRITSPLLHDSTYGIQHGAPIGGAAIIHPVPQLLQPQDNLTVQMTGSAVAGDIEHMSMIVAYDDLPGVDGNFISAAELVKRGVNLYSNVITIATGTTGQYTGSAAVNSGEDSFKANTDYALVGYDVSSASVHAVRFVGPDWGNLGVGGPAYLDANAVVATDDWFVRLNMIPVMNSANKGLTLIDAVADENGADPVVTMHWVELR